jgi:NAD(P)-dependent dehydrogenase (short-subunit alcohol dehydrogenase family)
MRQFEGRAVMVTGASKGIGYACAEAFVQAGAKVAIVSRSRDNLDAALARLGHGVVAIAADMRVPSDAARAVDDAEAALGPLDVLVNSAGAAKRYAPAELNAQAWRDAIDAKFFSYIYATDIVVKRMAARGHAAIYNNTLMRGKYPHSTNQSRR